MLRGWIMLSTLIFSVLFRLWPDYGTRLIGFPFSDKKLNTQSYVYYQMENIIAVLVASCLLIIHDNTPRWLIQLFVLLLIIDMIHFTLFLRDEGIGFNLLKVLCFGLPLLWIQSKQLLNR